MHDRGPCRTLAVALLAASAAFAASPAAAAPQVLALFSTDRPVALTCEGETCRAELPALCLQPGRRAPEAGRGYRLAEGQSLALVGRSVRGGPISVALDRELAIAAARTHVAVTVSVPRALLARYGFEDAGLEVGPHIAAVPLAAADDARPQTSDEIARAAGPGRRLAAALVDRDPDRMPAVRLMNRMANAPSSGESDGLWASMVADANRRGVSSAAIGFAEFNYGLCKFKTGNRGAAPLQQCLRELSDDSMEFLNADLEPALSAGG